MNNIWTRSALKTNGKAAMRRSYWKMVLTSLILAFILGSMGSSSVGGGNAFWKNGSSDHAGNAFGNAGAFSGYGVFNGREFEFDGLLPFAALIGIALVVFGIVVCVLAVAVNIFLFGPIEAGCRRVLIINMFEEPRLSEIGIAFRKESYMNVVKTQFFRALYTFLWSLLFVIPGIIKTYEYRMIPYILAENPQIDRKEAFRLSKSMMDGEKWRTFVLDLSFLGWRILGVFTCGILNVFYTNPYQECTNAELYNTLKNRMFSGQNAGQPQDNSQAQNTAAQSAPEQSAPLN